MAKPYVSALIDTYNHERFIEQAIASVLGQDMPRSDVEILVVDDGSTDGTPEIVRRFEPRVRLIRKPNGGQASAFNAGIPECRGEIVAFLDGDDWWAPRKLSRVVQTMNAYPSVGVLGHGIVDLAADGSGCSQAPKTAERFSLNSLGDARVFRLRKSFLGTSRMTFRAELLRRIGLVPTALTIEADEYLFTLGAALSEVMILPDTLTTYRLHGANLYSAGGGDSLGQRRKGQVLQALSSSLNLELARLGLAPEVVQCVTEIVQAEADQIRLSLDGGAPWETVQIERKIYGIMHEDAAASHQFFRTLTMIPAMVLPPRWFYAARRWLSEQNWYRVTRTRVLPVPAITRVAPRDDSKEYDTCAPGRRDDD